MSPLVLLIFERPKIATTFQSHSIGLIVFFSLKPYDGYTASTFTKAAKRSFSGRSSWHWLSIPEMERWRRKPQH